MRDHHVDRPEVEAGQPAQLTGTNRSIGLSVRTQRQKSLNHQGGSPPPQDTLTQLASGRFAGSRPGTPRPWMEAPGSSPGGAVRLGRAAPKSHGGLAGLVAIARGKTPDPIPNSAVKTLSADGTAPQGVEE